MSQQPEPPAWLYQAFAAAILAPDGTHGQHLWDALLAHGERWQRIGRAFYDDTDEGQPVLVIPLDRSAT